MNRSIKLLGIVAIIVIAAVVNPWLALVALVAIPVLSFYAPQHKAKKDQAMVAINERAAEEAVKVVELQTHVAQSILSKIPKIKRKKEEKIMEENKIEEPELYVASPKPAKAPAKPRGQHMKEWWAYKKSTGNNISLKEFVAKKKAGQL